MGKGRDKPPMYYQHKGLRDGDKVHGTSLRRAVNACPGFCSWKVDVLSRNFTAGSWSIALKGNQAGKYSMLPSVVPYRGPMLVMYRSIFTVKSA